MTRDELEAAVWRICGRKLQPGEVDQILRAVDEFAGQGLAGDDSPGRRARARSVHFEHRGRGVAACGELAYGKAVTTKLAEVTCRRCRQEIAYPEGGDPPIPGPAIIPVRPHTA